MLQILGEKDREELSIRAIEVADTHGDTAALLAAETRHATHFLLPASVGAAAAAAGAGDGRKRYAEQPGAEAYGADANASKVARTDAGAYGQAAVAAAPAGQAAAAAPASAYAAYGGGYAQGYGQYGGQYAAAGQYGAGGYGAAGYSAGYGGYGYGY